MDFSFDRGFAGGAGKIFFAVDRKLDGVVSRLSITVIKVAQSGAASRDAFPQSLANTGQEPAPVIFGQFSGLSGRTDSCMKKRFAGINISNSRELFGVHQERFDWRPGIFGLSL